ncbi:MAG: anaerobic ribonucleoside-triphosphate reductase [Aquificota bacterium]|nr:anaerobic ribonucleoside-triphosphate reductase [Aquificota bacterium]
MPEDRTVSLVDSYLGSEDLAKHNANLVYSLPAMANILSGEVMKEYMLGRILSEEERLMHEEGWWYQHQLALLGPYCIGFSARDIALNGLASNSRVMPRSRPPKRLRNLLDQCANFICLISQEVAGAVALNDLITVATSYVWYEEKFKGRRYTQDEIAHAFQSFLYNINLPFRSGNSPFTNVTLEFGKPAPYLEEEYVVVGGKVVDTKYREIPQELYDKVALGFLQAMWEGDADGRPWTFPLITVQITDSFNFEDPVFLKFLENLDRHGGAYFENFLSKPFLERGLEPRNPYLQRSFCCRFQVDLGEVLKVSNTGSVFGNASGVGSIGVISVNFNRLGWIHRGNKERLFEHLRDILLKARSVLNKKREFIEDHRDLYPTFFFYMKDLSTLFNTISLQGGHEGLINFGFAEYDRDGKLVEESSGLFHPRGLEFAKEVADFILRNLEEFMREDGVPWNFEYAPGETAGPYLARKDLEFFRDITEGRWERYRLYREYWLGKVDGKPPYVKGGLEGSGVFLTAGFQPPFDCPSIARQLEVSSHTQRFATGGSIQHIFLNEKPTAEALRNFIRKTFENLPIIYMTLTPTLSVCNTCSKKTVGEHFTCPYCGSGDTVVYSRVIGYYRPIARRIKKVDKDRFVYEGEENYWQGGRRADWVVRKKVIMEELLGVHPWG